MSAPHDLTTYLALLKRNGTLTLVGAPEAPTPVGMFNLIFGRRRLAGSLIGGLRETQEMLDFCAQHGITSDIELIPISKINEAYDYSDFSTTTRPASFMKTWYLFPSLHDAA